MKSITIEISEPDDKGCVKVKTKKTGNFAAFEITGILDTVKQELTRSECAGKKAKKKK